VVEQMELLFVEAIPGEIAIYSHPNSASTFGLWSKMTLEMYKNAHYKWSVIVNQEKVAEANGDLQ